MQGMEKNMVKSKLSVVDRTQLEVQVNALLAREQTAFAVFKNAEIEQQLDSLRRSKNLQHAEDLWQVQHEVTTARERS